MKIIQEHYDHIKAEIDKTLSNYPNIIEEYETGKFSRSEKVKDLQRRFCFDLMTGAGLTSFICKTVYSYANDDHIFTALKKACPKVTRRY